MHSNGISTRARTSAWTTRIAALLGGAALTVCLALPAWGQTPPSKPFVMAADAEPTSYLFQWARLIYTEAFTRMGVPLEMTTYTLARRTALIEDGVIDGEVSRIYAYADAHPGLIRIEEPVMDFTFSVYTGSPSLRAQKLDELPVNTMVEHRRGILMCENALKKSFAPELISNVTSTEQGLKKLLARRSDAYCDIDAYIKETLQTSADLKGTTGVRKLFDLAAVPTYPYIFRRHADLAPKLTATLKQMRAEGLLVAYPKQAERMMGWSQ